MQIKIIKTSSSEEVEALIEKGIVSKLPSIHDGWRFNFGSQLKKMKNATGYILVTSETPDVIEGCIIFQLINKREPYLAYIEIAPHNRGDDKRYERVAGCLLAYAYKLSIIYGVGCYRAFLQFDILEKKKKTR